MFEKIKQVQTVCNLIDKTIAADPISTEFFENLIAIAPLISSMEELYCKLQEITSADWSNYFNAS